MLWKYDIKDTTTWKYIDYETRKISPYEFRVTWIKNPSFAYAHLSPYSPYDKDANHAATQRKIS